MKATATVSEKQIWDLLRSIPDPEIPVISIVDLGVIRNVQLSDDTVNIEMTPTYSGCPALFAMQDDVRQAMNKIGLNVVITVKYKPAWTTDWLAEEAKVKLKEYGIAPPAGRSDELKNPFAESNRAIQCPFCNSIKTSLTSAFGSTACKSLHYCNDCMQPFEHFKCH